MKKLNLLIVALLMITIYAGCKKNDAATSTPAAITASDNYASMAAFHAQNGVPMQTFTINAVTGGSFTTPQGTIVTIPANAFQTQAGGAVTGNVLIQFKDIYKKSDMLLSDKATRYFSGIPLKSGGEFFIKAMQANVPVMMANNKKISIKQPLNGIALDTAMAAMSPTVPLTDTIGSWSNNYYDTVLNNTNSYIFSLYKYNTPIDSGSWCNSDNPNYFAGVVQTTLTLNPTDPNWSNYYTQVYLMFTGINSMVHVYNNGNTFPYYYAPLTAQCTLVAIGISGGKLYSSFTPITITNNLTVNFTLSETTTADFKTRLNTLN